MTERLPTSLDEAVVCMDSIIDALIESLRHGAASQTLEYDDAIELAVDLGSARTMVKIIKKMNNDKSFASLLALIIVWRSKYASIHGDDTHG